MNLTVIIPYKNDEDLLSECIASLFTAEEGLRLSRRNPSNLGITEVIIVDDHSSPRLNSATDSALINGNKIPLRVVLNEGVGRFSARMTGARMATSPLLLFLDTRVLIDKNSLSNLSDLFDHYPEVAVWNGDIWVDSLANPFAAFWHVTAHLLWPQWFKYRDLAIVENDVPAGLPRGTGLLAVNRQDFLTACVVHEGLDDTRFISDDTDLIDDVAKRKAYGISSKFVGLYRPRTRLTPFARQSFYRGRTFVNGHIRARDHLSRLLVILVISLVTAASLIATGLSMNVRVLVLAPWLIFTAVIIALYWRKARFKSLRLREIMTASVAVCVFAPCFTCGMAAEAWKVRRRS